VLLLRSNDQEYNNSLASFATCLCRQRNELRTCAKHAGGLTVTTLLQARNQEGRTPLTPREKCVGHSSKILGPSQKTLLLTWSPKLVTGLLCPYGPRVHLSGPAYMHSCIRLEVRFPFDQRILCSDCCKKCRLPCLAQVVFSHFVLHSSKIPLMLTTKVALLRNLLFIQLDGVNCVVS